MLQWEATTLQSLGGLSGYTSRVNMAVYTTEGNDLRIITAGDDRTIRRWSASSGRQVDILQTLPERALSATPSRDGRRLLVTASDRRVRIWNLETGEPLAELPTLSSDLVLADYSADGSHFVVAGNDGVARIFRDDYVGSVDGMLADGCNRLRYRPEFSSVAEVCATDNGAPAAGNPLTP